MTQFGDLYSQYYDLLYQDKDYQGEVDYVDKLIKEHSKSASTILDLGCGTGRHAELFYEKGYNVYGVDISDEMLKRAESRRCGKEDRLTFSQADITTLNFDQKFDIVMSIFHVMSYLNSNIDLLSFFEVAHKHLLDKGLFIFDFWYGPAVLTDRPVVRVRNLEADNSKIIRIAEPVMYAQDNLVEVNYTLFFEDKETTQIFQKNEQHKMRYFFDSELEMICEKVGFKILEKRSWLTERIPNYDSWYVVWVVQK